MPEVRFVAMTIVLVGLLLAAARLTRLPPSILLFAGGVASILLPGPLPPVHVNPLIVLGLLLPPLLYAGVTDLSPATLRHAAWRGVATGAAMTTALVAATGYATHLLLPGLDPVACMAVGVALAIAEPRIASETGALRAFPRAMSDGLAAQLASAPLVGVSLSLIAAKAVGHPLPTLPAIAWTFGKDLALGGALGALLGYGIATLRRRLTDAPAEAALSLATPFAAAAIGDVLGLNPIAVLIAAGLVLAWRSVDRETGESIASPESRLLTSNLWKAVSAVLNGALFFLMGRALPEALHGANALPWTTLAATAAALLALCAAVQFALSWATLAAPSAPPVPTETGATLPPWKAATLLSLGAGRSVVALAIALALPATAPDGTPYPARDAVIALVALAVIASHLLQWAALPPLLAWTRPAGEREAEAESAAATEAATGTAPQDPEAARRALRALRDEDRIGDAALHEGEATAALRARAAEVEAGKA